MSKQYYAATSDEGPYHLGPFLTKEAALEDAKTEFADELFEGVPELIKELAGSRMLPMKHVDKYDNVREALTAWRKARGE